MLNSFLFAETPDGGFGYKDSKDSRLSIVFFGSTDDLEIAQAAMELCKHITGRPLYIDAALYKALLCTKCDEDGAVVENYIQIRVNKDILMELAKDADNPLYELTEDLYTIYQFLRFTDRYSDVTAIEPYGEQMKNFLRQFHAVVYSLFEKEPFKCGLTISDMAWLQTHYDWEIADQNMKLMYAIQMDHEED